MNNRIINRLVAVFALCLVACNLPGAVKSVYVIKIDSPGLTLNQKWQQAISTNNEKIDHEYFWVGYSIERMMKPDSNIIMSNCDGYGMDFESVLSGKLTSREDPKDKKEFMIHNGKTVLNLKDKKSRMLVERKYVFLLKTDSAGEISDINLFPMDSDICFNGSSLIWLGEVSNSESFEFFKIKYRETKSADAKEKIVSAVANHEMKAEIGSFLKSVIEKSDNEHLRVSAIFWLGTVADGDGCKYLENLAFSDGSREARKQAVFAIYISDSENKIERLISLIKRSKDVEIKKETVFWLGQLKSSEISSTLEDIAVTSPEEEVQKSAVFALSQMRGSESIKKLLNIARKHKSIAVRKDAIFWLGQMNSDEATEAIIQLAEEK